MTDRRGEYLAGYVSTHPHSDWLAQIDQLVGERDVRVADLPGSNLTGKGTVVGSFQGLHAGDPALIVLALVWCAADFAPQRGGQVAGRIAA